MTLLGFIMKEVIILLGFITNKGNHEAF